MFLGSSEEKVRLPFWKPLVGEVNNALRLLIPYKPVHKSTSIVRSCLKQVVSLCRVKPKGTGRLSLRTEHFVHAYVQKIMCVTSSCPCDVVEVSHDMFPSLQVENLPQQTILQISCNLSSDTCPSLMFLPSNFFCVSARLAVNTCFGFVRMLIYQSGPCVISLHNIGLI